MKNLKVWQKLAVMGFVFMIPFAAVTYKMVSSIDKLGIEFARQESRGVSYAAPLLTLLKELQQHRDMASAWLAGEAAFKERLDARRTGIERQLAVVDAIDQQLDANLHLTAAWQRIRADCLSLLGAVSQLTPDDSFERHTTLIAAVIGHIQAVSDASNLTLDPDLDTYYLMSATMFQGPELVEALGQARALGTRLVAGRSVPAKALERLDDLPPHIEYLGQQFARSFEKTLAANAALHGQLQEPVGRIRGAVGDAITVVARATNGRTGGTAAADYFAATTRSIDAIFEAKAEALATLDQLLSKRIERFRREINLTLLAAGLGLLVVSLVGLFMMRDITRPLQRVVGIADRIGQGDLGVELSLAQTRRDEIGDLARSFDHMVGFLREMVHVTEEIAGGNLMVAVKPQSQRDVIGSALASMTANLSTLVGHVQKSGLQVNSSVNQIAATAKQQQSTATEIAATTMQVGATSKQISATSKELLKNISEVSKVADESAALAGAGQTGLMHMEATMRQVVEATGVINGKLSVLNEKAGNISQVITTITKVADQTNLLSLNAAIEAEKAGEYGRGFSVVATEIRRLADQTAVATYDIEQMVKEIQSAVSAGVMGMDRFSEDVRRGMHDVQQIGSQLTQIIQQVQALAPRFEEVNHGMQAQATGAEQITQALGQLNDAAQQTVKSLRHSTEAIDGLTDFAAGLHSGVARFRLSVA